MDYLLPILGALVALGGFLFGVYQYWNAQRWRKREAAADQLKRLASDESLAACCMILDWSKRTIVVPQRYRLIFGADTFDHNWNHLAQGMKPESEANRFTEVGTLYRDLFDEFFSFLDETNDLVDMRFVSLRDLKALQYWLHEIAEPRHLRDQVFKGFIQYYRYEGVEELMKKFGIAFR